MPVSVLSPEQLGEAVQALMRTDGAPAQLRLAAASGEGETGGAARVVVYAGFRLELNASSAPSAVHIAGERPAEAAGGEGAGSSGTTVDSASSSATDGSSADGSSELGSASLGVGAPATSRSVALAPPPEGSGVVIGVAAGAPPVRVSDVAVCGGLEVSGGVVALSRVSFLDPSAAECLPERRRRRLANVATVGAVGLRVTGGEVEISECSFVGLSSPSVDGGALRVAGGTVRVRASVFERNRAPSGGAIALSGGELHLHGCRLAANRALGNGDGGGGGGALYVSGGGATVSASVLANNSANTARGGGVLVSGGQLVLSNRSAVVGNGAPEGATAYASGGMLEYELPAPLGRWVASAFFLDPYLGLNALEDAFPFECSAGFHGAVEGASFQSGPTCYASCPSGFYCPSGTVEPIACRNGTYCGVGSASETPCAAGSYGTRPRLTSQEECTRCEQGHFCMMGARFGCGAGTFSPQRGAADESACERCPLHASTPDGAPPATSAAACVCDVGFFHDDAAGASAGQGVLCEPCGVGTNCTAAGVELSALPLLPGYWRAGLWIRDAQRCPDANAEAPGCQGDGCKEGLTGPYCLLCAANDSYYDSWSATCPPCEMAMRIFNPIRARTMIAGGAALLLGGLAALFVCVRRRHIRRQSAGARAAAVRLLWLASRLRRLQEFVKPKLKLVLGFWQIATSIEAVFEVTLPASASASLKALAIVNVDLQGLGIPLACVGIGTHADRLFFLMLLPPLFSASALLLALLESAVLTGKDAGRLSRQAHQRHRESRERLARETWAQLSKEREELQERKPSRPSALVETSLLEHMRRRMEALMEAKLAEAPLLVQARHHFESALLVMLPITLKVSFFAFTPIATLAFRAFSCVDVGDGSEYMAADLSVQCRAHAGGPLLEEYVVARRISSIAIALYPVALPLLFGLMLASQRRALLARRTTALSRALGFLHEEYRPETYWWELTLIAQKLIFVGAPRLLQSPAISH